MPDTQYITLENDRWDLIALKAYGDCTQDQIRYLMAANPYETTKEFFRAGVRLLVPILEEPSPGNLDALLPPWKRAEASSSTAGIINFIRNEASPGSGSFDASFD
jgi:hypothetical protein